MIRKALSTWQVLEDARQSCALLGCTVVGQVSVPPGVIFFFAQMQHMDHART